jgi:hypothetical protein
MSNAVIPVMMAIFFERLYRNRSNRPRDLSINIDNDEGGTCTLTVQIIDTK